MEVYAFVLAMLCLAAKDSAVSLLREQTATSCQRPVEWALRMKESVIQLLPMVANEIAGMTMVMMGGCCMF